MHFLICPHHTKEKWDFKVESMWVLAHPAGPMLTIHYGGGFSSHRGQEGLTANDILRSEKTQWIDFKKYLTFFHPPPGMMNAWNMEEQANSKMRGAKHVHLELGKIEPGLT